MTRLEKFGESANHERGMRFACGPEIRLDAEV